MKKTIVITIYLTVVLGLFYAYTLIEPPTHYYQSSFSRYILFSAYFLGLTYKQPPKNANVWVYALVFLLSFFSWAILLFTKFANINFKEDYQTTGNWYRGVLFVFSFVNWAFIARKILGRKKIQDNSLN